MSDEHLHDWLDNRPGPDRPSLAEAEADERQGEARAVVGADAITLAETWIANATHLREQKEDLMSALREEGFELAAAMRMIDRRDRKLAEAKLLAEHWIRSSDNRTRRLGADLKQVLDG